jgi:uncharacterized repeat protein (TIGR01451 family)
VKRRAVILGLCVTVITFVVSSAFSTNGTAIPDSVETFASEIFVLPASVFANGSVVFVTASDGASFGGFTVANVTDETFGDFILVNLYDDGTGPGDIPDDGIYTGNFTLVDDLGVNGQFTDDILDILDLRDGAIATVLVDIDLQMDPGSAMIVGDFSPPNVTINSGPDTVDLAYTLNVTITDPNVDIGNAWYNVDGGTNRRLTYRGGNDYEIQIDTSSLLDGPHTIRVVANDIVLNSDSTKTVTITVDHPAPDISLTVTHAPEEPKEGDRVTFTVVIENTGDADAADVSVSLIVDGTEVDTETETIHAGLSSTVVLDWTATEGSHDIEVQLSGTGVDIGSPIETFDIQPVPEDLLESPWFMAGLIIVFTMGLIGGTVLYAKTARDLARGTTGKPLPVEHVPTVPPGEVDPCEEIRKKWKAILAEHERAKAEMDSARRRADQLRNEADEAREEERKASQEVEEANKNYVDARKSFEELKQKMHDFFEEGIAGEGISVGYPKEGQQNQVGFFKEVVKVFFRSPEQERDIALFLDENSASFNKFEEEYEDAEKGLMALKQKVATSNRTATEARAEAEAAESKSAQAEQEYQTLWHEVQSLEERAGAFRQKWRICMLKRLDEAVDRAENASQQATEAAKRAKNAKDREEFEKIKEDAQAAREKGGQAKEDSKGIKQKLEDEDLEEDISEQEDRIERAESDASSAAKEVFALGAKFFQDQI